MAIFAILYRYNHTLMKKLIIILSALAVSLSLSAQEKISVVPYPNDVQINDGSFDAAGRSIYHDRNIDAQSLDLISQFADQLSLVSGKKSKMHKGSSDKGFVFVKDASVSSEAYKIDVTEKCVKVAASDLRGFNYAIQTLKQLMPVQIFGNEKTEGINWSIPCVAINDAPRFAYRGMHLDEARHFFGVEEVKRYIDIMEVHKLNTLHWHLTDDQGWRIEIKKYPELTEIGAVRSGTCIKGDGSTTDGIPYGEGMWYSQDQIREIVAYAAAKGIDVLPEIDLPGHMLAALAAYPELGCKGTGYEVWHRWGVSKDVLCLGNDNVYGFLKDVLAEVCELFPYEYIHIGGDECPKDSWKVCPKCQAKIQELGLKAKGKYSAEHYLQSYVMAQMEAFLNEKGKKAIGWDEILEGEVSENATIMSWRGEEGGIEAARLGHDAVMTPHTYYYLDYYQSIDVENEPFGIGGYLPVETCYSYEPCPDTMTEDVKKHIIGVQANLWTEYVSTADHLEYMLLPRMTALSEVQWCNADRKDWNRFLNSADEFCKIYETMGYNYATHLFNADGEVVYDAEGNRAVVTLHTHGNAPIHYTIDGTEPDEHSPKYTGPISLYHSCELRALAIRDDFPSRSFKYRVDFNKATGRPISAANKKVKAGILVDALRGPEVRKRHEWLTITAKPLEVVIDMQGSDPYSSVKVGTMVLKTKEVFNPTYLTVSVSDDGSTFSEIVHADYPVEGQFEPNGLKEYEVTFPETTSRYLKVSVGCLSNVPQWHHYYGRKASIFVDEIMVR